MAPVLEDAALIVSELITNAFQAECTSAQLRVGVDWRQVRVGVTDDAAGRPEVRPAAAADACGRGLVIVDALASDWGVRWVWQGKEVWATLALPPALTSRLGRTW